MLSAAAVMAPAAATQKSSLEVLLETLKKRDEQPKDAPPTLPARPTCRGRLPTTRRSSLPAGFMLENGMATVAATEAVVVDKKADAKIEIAGLEVITWTCFQLSGINFNGFSTFGSSLCNKCLIRS